MLGASFSASNILGCCCGLLAVPELDSLVESNADAGSEIFSPSDRAMALINISSCSLSLLEGLDDKLKLGASEVEGVSWAPAGARGSGLPPDVCLKDDVGDTGLFKR